MDKGFVVPSGQGKVWNMAPGRSAALKMLNGDTADSVMMFEEVAPASTETPLHTHDDSDEIAYVLSGEITFKIGDEITVGDLESDFPAQNVGDLVAVVVGMQRCLG